MLLSGTALAVPLTLLEEGMESFPIGGGSEILEDAAGRFSILEVVSPVLTGHFSGSGRAVPSFGFSDSVFWMRFRLKNGLSRPAEWILEHPHPNMDWVTAYFLRPDGTLEATFESGDKIPLTEREVRHRHPLFPVTLAAGDSIDVYLRFASNGTMRLPVKIWNPASFARHDRLDRLVRGLLYGALAVIALYNLLILTAVRDSTYLYYVLYIIGNILFLSSFDGIAYELLWPDSPGWKQASPIFFGSFGMVFVIQFTRRYLDIKRNAPGFNVVFLVLTACALATMAAPFLVQSQVVNRCLSLEGFVIPVTLLTAGAVCWRRGYRPARYFLVAWLWYLAGMGVLVLTLFGILPINIITENAYRIGSVIEVTLLSLALGDRFNIFKKEREEALRRELDESRKVAALSETFRRFVPREFLESLEKRDILSIELGDCIRKEMSILFSDIRSFTTLSERMSPERNFRFINAYHRTMEPVVTRHGGFIVKFLGDGVMALFEGDPDRAVAAAVAMQAELDGFNREFGDAHGGIRIGIGIHTGPMMLGIVGGRDRMEGTVISDAVNLASRIEGMNKNHGSSILISGMTHHRLNRLETFSMRLIDWVRVRGRVEPVSIYEVFDADPPGLKESKLDTRDSFQEAVALFHDGDRNRAATLFRDCLARCRDDVTARAYLSRCDGVSAG